MQGVIKEKGKVTLRTPEITIEVRDLDETATKGEIVQAMRMVLQGTCEPDTHVIGPSPRGQMTALVNGPNHCGETARISAIENRLGKLPDPRKGVREKGASSALATATLKRSVEDWIGSTIVGAVGNPDTKQKHAARTRSAFSAQRMILSCAFGGH